MGFGLESGSWAGYRRFGLMGQFQAWFPQIPLASPSKEGLFYWVQAIPLQKKRGKDA